MIDPSVILALFAMLPTRFEQGDVAAVSEAISGVAANRTEAAMMVSLAWHETKVAKYVLEGRCNRPPKGGARCDSGRALGVWQLHRSACREAWKLATPNGGPAGQIESLPAQAVCVRRLLRWNYHRGAAFAKSPLHAAFNGYGARDWQWVGADKRVKTVEYLLKRWPHAAT